MSKLGFKPKWTPLHDKRAEEFQETYFASSKKDTAADHDAFMKWAYGKS